MFTIYLLVKDQWKPYTVHDTAYMAEKAARSFYEAGYQVHIEENFA